MDYHRLVAALKGDFVLILPHPDLCPDIHDTAVLLLRPVD